jgi:glycosyltransferase involved in cell wall biosynthesis
MRLLFLTPQLPYPADKGTRIRNFGLIKELAGRHDLAVLSFGDPDDRAAIAGLERHCRVLAVVPPAGRGRLARAARALVDPAPDLARRLSSDAYRRRLAEALAAERPDVVQIEALEMVPHWLATRRVGGPAAVLDAHNAEWILQQRHGRTDALDGRAIGAAYSLLQARKLRRYEGRALDAADAVVCVSAEDARALRSVGCPRRLAIVPNGVDVGAMPRRPAEPAGETVLFTGTMDYRPNVDAARWFVTEVWPLVRRARPAARFVIAGRDPAPSVRALGARPGVEVTGAVPEVAPLFRAAAVYAAPLRIGGGVRLKILEAFAHGAPVVSTGMGAEGIDLVDGRDALLADEPAAFARAVVRLLDDPAAGRALADGGRALVEARYDWRVLAPALEALYDQLVPTSRGAVAPAL